MELAGRSLVKLMKSSLGNILHYPVKVATKSVALKIGAILLFMSLTTVIVSYVGITKIHDLNQVANEIFFSNTSVLFPLSDISEVMYQIETSCAVAASQCNRVAVAGLYSEMQNLSGMVGNLATILSAKETADIESHLKKYKSYLQEYLNQVTSNGASLQISYDRFLKESTEFHDLLYGLNKQMRITGMKTYNKGKNIYSSVITLQTLITILGVAIAIFIGVMVAFSIILPLRKLRSTTELLAQGDLRARADIKSRDEVGIVAAAFDRAIDELRRMVTEASVNAKNISTSSNELFKVTDETSRSLGELNQLVAELANGATNQTQTVDSASQKLKKAISLTSSVAEATAAINNTCKEASISAERGGAAAGEMTVVINKLVETVDITNQIAQNLSEDYQEIRQMVDVIRDIAEKTNLLSLNASIEAARAGEHGRGFAVVASNIRQLSIQARESVEHIDDRMNQIFEKTDKATTAMEQSTAEVDKGRNTLIETVNTFKDLVNQVAEIVASISQITDIAEQLSESNREVITEMANVSQISQDNLAAVEEVSATFQEQYASTMVVTEAARQLQALAIQLSASAEKFKV